MHRCRTGSRPEEIEAAEAEIARLEAQRRYLEAQLQRVRVTSPLAGIIGKRRILDLMTRRLARYVRVEFWSWW